MNKFPYCLACSHHPDPMWNCVDCSVGGNFSLALNPINKIPVEVHTILDVAERCCRLDPDNPEDGYAHADQDIEDLKKAIKDARMVIPRGADPAMPLTKVLRTALDACREIEKDCDARGCRDGADAAVKCFRAIALAAHAVNSMKE